MSASERIRALLFPPKCSSCKTLLSWYEAGRSNGALCGACAEKWENAQRELCTFCGETVNRCACLTEELKHARAEALYKSVYYVHGKRDPVQNRVIFQIKNTRSTRTVQWLASLLCVHLTQIRSERGGGEVLLTFVPRGKQAKLDSGTDQAEALARVLSKLSGIPMRKVFQRNPHAKRPQKTLSQTERIRVAKETFVLRPEMGKEVCGKTVVLVDDIVTTGASMAACGRLLRGAGASFVCLSVAVSDVICDTGAFPPKKK